MVTPAPAREIELIAALEGVRVIDAPFATFNEAGTHALITDEDMLGRIDRKSLSPSTFKVLSECVGQWAVTKKLPEPESVFKPNNLGTEAHQLFEDMFNLHPSLRSMAGMKSAIQARADKLFAVGGTDVFEPLSKIVDPEALDEAMALLRQRWIYEVSANVRGMWQGEKPAEVAVYQNEMSFDGITIGGAPATGLIDRITIDLVSMGVNPGSLTTMSDEELSALSVRAAELGFLKANDWKTGKVGQIKYSKGYHDQLRVYAIAIKKKTGKYPVAAELDYTKSFPTGDEQLLKAYGYEKPAQRPTKGTKVAVDIRPVALRKTEREFGQAWADLRSYVDNGAFPLQAGVLCGWCPLVAVCPAAKAAGKGPVKEGLPTAEEIVIGDGEPLSYRFGRFGRIAPGTEANPAPHAVITATKNTQRQSPTTSTDDVNTEQEITMSNEPMNEEVYDDPADAIIAANDVPVPDVNEDTPAPRARSSRTIRTTKSAATDPKAPGRTSQRTARTRSSGVAAALEDAPESVAAAETETPAEAPAAKASPKARAPRASARAKTAAQKSATEDTASSINESPEEAAMPTPIEDIPPSVPEPVTANAAPEYTDQAASEVSAVITLAKSLNQAMTDLKAELHLAIEAAGAAVEARKSEAAVVEETPVASPIKLSGPHSGVTMITQMPILSEEKSTIETSGTLLNPNSPAARAVFSTPSWALKMLVFEGQKVTEKSMNGLTNILGTLIVRLHSEFSDEPKWQDGGNSVVRDVLRSVVPDVKKPWGGSAEDWEAWGEKVFKRSRLVLLVGYTMYSEGVSDDPYAELAAATSQAN